MNKPYILVTLGMTFNATGFTLAMIQRKLDDISDKLDTLLEKDKKLGPPIEKIITMKNAMP